MEGAVSNLKLIKRMMPDWKNFWKSLSLCSGLSDLEGYPKLVFGPSNWGWKESKPPDRPLHQLRPAEQIAVKEHVEDLLTKRKIEGSKPQYGVPLFTLKENDKMGGDVDSRTLSKITKRRNASIPRTDEIFDQIEGAKAFQKLTWELVFIRLEWSKKMLKRVLSIPNAGSLCILDVFRRL